MRKIIVVTYLLFYWSCIAYAGTNNAKPIITRPPLQARYDSSTVTLRRLDPVRIKKFRDNPEFNYNTETGGNRSWWDRFWSWVWRMLARLFSGNSSSPSISPIAKYIALVIAVGAAVFIIIKLLSLSHIFSRKPKQVAIPYSESTENINEIDFDAAIEKAWSEGDYRLGVRLLYLQSLKQLNDAGLINWQIGKTNTAYLNELADPARKQSFSVLTNQFEYVWYGDFPVDKLAYQRINTLFLAFKKTLA